MPATAPSKPKDKDKPGHTREIGERTVKARARTPDVNRQLRQVERERTKLAHEAGQLTGDDQLRRLNLEEKLLREKPLDERTDDDRARLLKIEDERTELRKLEFDNEERLEEIDDRLEASSWEQLLLMLEPADDGGDLTLDMLADVGQNAVLDLYRFVGVEAGAEDDADPTVASGATSS